MIQNQANDHDSWRTSNHTHAEQSLRQTLLCNSPELQAGKSLTRRSALCQLSSGDLAGRPELKLATALFQNLFPAINVQTAKLSTCQVSLLAPLRPSIHLHTPMDVLLGPGHVKRHTAADRPRLTLLPGQSSHALCVQRVVLLSFDKETERISFRHYGISAAPSGVTKSVKSLVNRRQLPNMGALGDVSELLTKSGYGSVSSTPCPSRQNTSLLIEIANLAAALSLQRQGRTPPSRWTHLEHP